MNKAICISLLIILLMQIGGLSLLYRIKQRIVQDEMAERIDNDVAGFETIVIPLSNFEKAKMNSREISYQGKMYDIKSVKRNGSEVKLQVLNDSKEERIINQLKSLANQQPTKSTSQSQFLLKLIELLYTIPDSSIVTLLQTIRSDYSSFSAILITQAKSIFSPPPEMV